MASLSAVILFAFLGSVVSLIGGFLILRYKNIGGGIENYAAPFAAGALLSAALVDLLPEAVESDGSGDPLVYVLVGIMSFFFLERYLRWFHQHRKCANPQEANSALIIIGDTVHNLIDGAVLAAAFLASSGAGIIATIAVAAHEVPQEIGDFGLLLKKGLSNRQIILINLISALATVLSAAGFFVWGRASDIGISPFLGLAAGFFIYIALSDIIPDIHGAERKQLVGIQSLMLVVGAVTVALICVSIEH